MLTSSKINPIPFKDLSNGSIPNRQNTLFADRKHAGFRIVDYCQKFSKDDVVVVQFTSDSNVVPTFKSYAPAEIETIVGTLESSYNGDYDRYFFNFEITLGANYYDKKVYFIVTQGSDTLRSEPIYCKDLSDDLLNGSIKKIYYSNLDRNDSDLSDYWLDWSVLDPMFFYVEAVDIDLNDQDESEVLTGSQSKSIISANSYEGIILKSAPVSDHLVSKLRKVSLLDYFEVNGIQYIRDGSADPERWGKTNLFQVEMNLTEKNVIGLNVDDLGITYLDTNIMAVQPKRNTAVNTSGWQVENPEGFMLHSIFIRHAATSAGNAVVNIGTTPAGNDILDDVQGNVSLADYSSIWKSISSHYLKDPDASSLIYVSVSGAGAVLDIIINFDTVTE